MPKKESIFNNKDINIKKKNIKKEPKIKEEKIKEEKNIKKELKEKEKEQKRIKKELEKKEKEIEKIKKSRKYEEENLQVSCVKYLREIYPNILFHCSVQANLGEKQGLKRKRLGNLKGYPDITILKKNNRYGGLFIELKGPKGKTSKEQDEVIKKLNDEGYLSKVINSYENFKKVVDDYLLI